MSRIVLHCLLLTAWFVHIDSEAYQDRPKIKTLDGDLILEPGYDKNIYIRPNGPKSTVFVGQVNILKENVMIHEQTQPSVSDDVDKAGILQRLSKLESQRNDFYNTTALWTKVNRLKRRVNNIDIEVFLSYNNNCSPDLCEHGGTCLNLKNGFHCLCLSNWEGKRCDVDVNECRNFAGTDLGCQNGATCINKPGTYECLCRNNWFGLHCTRKAKDCSGGDLEICGFGTCIQTSTGEGIKCLCNQGWTTNGTGAACLTDVNECDSQLGPRCSVNPKVTCINLQGSFRCGDCPLGYEGDGFSCNDIDECITQNGGCSPLVACHNTIGSRICDSCPPGYLGDGTTCTWRGSCNINRGGCHPSAQCLDNSLATQCICPDGMNGDGIGIHGCYVLTGGNYTHKCVNNPCGSHGQCHMLEQGYTCICFAGFSGAHCDTPTDYCTSNPCRNGGSCHPDSSLTRGFRCECTAQYSGPLCQVFSNRCGSVLNNEEGSIVYPLSNSSYSHNSSCAWVIQTVTDKVINVTFSKFDLEQSTGCLFDFLQIHDGRSSASQLIGRFCGTNLPKRGNIISSHNTLYFWFRSDSTVAKQGFTLYWTSIQPVCGGDVDATTHGRISSPGSPGKYPPNRDCYWHITTSLGKRIQLYFFEFDIESHTNCSFDFLAIYDGARTTDSLLNKYCNSTQPAPIQSAGSDVLIHFHSDAFASGNGFQITYAPVEGVPGCGGYFTRDKGEITSPSYNGSYLNNMLCEYKIRTSPDTLIRIQFYTFELEGYYNTFCRHDYLKIYDGPSVNSPLIGKYCGYKIPEPRVSSSNELCLVFKSDYNIVLEGFRMGYELICSITVTGDSGIIKSPGYPFRYPENRMCQYTISTDPGKAIKLTFQDFDIEDSSYYRCVYDYVEIRDGPNENSTLLGRYCGNHKPLTQISQHNFMYVKFNSDSSSTGMGFYANYTTIATKCGGIYKNMTGTINYPSDHTLYYGSDQTCIWILDAPDGMHITLTWNRFDVDNRMSSCESDYLELTEIDKNNNETYFGKYCRDTTPPAFSTSSNRLKIKFTSYTNFQASAFSISYTFLKDITHCNALYTQTHGFIFSPGWPNRYEPNRECNWIIIAPEGQQIKLNIHNFDTERSIRHNCNHGDYLEIRNGATDNSPLVGKICGNVQANAITSLGNSLHIHFHSGRYTGGEGFKIEYDGSIVGCGGTITGSSGSISSPNYPNVYPNNAECFYRIIVSHGSVIQIMFIQLELERTHNCKDDYIEIFDGRDTSAASLGRFCKMSFALSPIVTISNAVFLKFRSDFLLGGIGFKLNYQTNCHNNVTGRYGIIESPNFPNNYPRYLDCLWTINVPKGNRINITFTHFHIFKKYEHRRISANCSLDYLQMKDTSDIMYSNKLCGDVLPQAFTTKSNSFQIRFHAISIFLGSKSGFQLEWVVFGCGGHLQKATGTIHIDSSMISKGEMECEWLIETAEGTSINLVFTDVFLTDSKNCLSDAIEIYNGQNVHSPLITRFCQRNTFSVQSTANFMLVRLVKHSSMRDLHFVGQYSSAHSVCGGAIYSHSGFIYSKNYPQDYDNNLDCIWSIRVPLYHRIELNFIDFDLNSYSNHGNGDTCEDSIKIYDGLLSSNYTYRICPNSNGKNTQVLSKGSYLEVQFTTNEAGTAKGFKANFSVTCGTTIRALYSGILSNDNLVGHLSKNCTWTITAPQLNQKIYLTFTHMDIPINRDIITNRTCSSSYLRVNDGDGDDAPLIDEYCGRKVPPMIVSQGNAITIELGTYGDTITGQFSANYSPLEETCGGTFTSEQGAIASPNYPRPYRPNTDCEWILSTSPGNRVYVTFGAFDINYSDGCNEDYLEIRESNGGGKLLGLYCGNKIPTNTTVSSKIYIKFHSTDNNNGRGFLLHYGFLHGNEIYEKLNGEISSPLYPFLFKGSGDYWWRIVTNGTQTISVTIDKLEIPSYGDVCDNKLSIYEGYDAEAPTLSELCGLLTESKVIVSTSNTIFVKLYVDDSNTGAVFHLLWAVSDLVIDETETGKVNCGHNYTVLVPSGQSRFLQSPKYPKYYDPDLLCEWVFKSELGRHLSIHFLDFQLEETTECYADSVSVYSASKPNEWKPIKEQICLAEAAKSLNNLTSSLVQYIKIRFKTEYSNTGRGFRAKVSSECGGMISQLSTSFGPTWLDVHVGSTSGGVQKCEWIVKVRPGRQIKLKFQHFNITNSDDDCKTYILLRNGNSIEAPLLSNGKYCGYSHENRTEIETSSNALFVIFIYGEHKRENRPDPFQNFIIHYEENDVNCGGTITLSTDFNSEVINSPNFPSVAVPYSVCEWVIIGPPGEILRADFIERFDLEDVDDCATEVVEIRDGPSRLSTLKGRFCGKKPGTIKTSNNIMYVKYVTELAEPRNGFRANISIDICGGTLMATNGELKSPGYPHLPMLFQGTVCVWRLLGNDGHVFNIHPEDIHLPQSGYGCTTKITIEETVPENNTEVVLKTYCDKDAFDSSSIQTWSNNVTIKLHIGSHWNQLTDFRGFRFDFHSSRPRCGGIISMPEGYIYTPNYPFEIKLKSCYWVIRVPNKARRIRLEILDMDSSRQLIYISSNVNHRSDFIETEPTKWVYESTGSTLIIHILKKVSSPYRFKAKFSSNEPALCGGQLHGLTGEIVSPDINGTYSCQWQYSTKPDTNIFPIQSYNYDYSTIFLMSVIASSVASTRCSYFSPHVMLSIGALFPTKFICGNMEASFRIPSNFLNIQALNTNRNSFYFHLNFTAQPCGGVVEPGEDYVNVIDIPISYNDTLDCVWTIKVPVGSSSVEMKLDGSFELECQDEFLHVTKKFGSPAHILFEYCKGKMQEAPAVTHFRYMYIEYHSYRKNHTMNNIKVMVRTINEVCGKRLERYDRVFKSPNFPKSYKPNQECAWEIKADVGYRVSLRFIERFVIEMSPNCTSDAVIIYDWIDDEYIEIDKLCGRELPGSYNSTNDRMKVVFRTDNKTNLDGFKAHWSQICGGTYYATEKDQILYSPGYPHGYEPNMNCVYNIKLRDFRSPSLNIQFEDFLLEGSYPDCLSDNLTIDTHDSSDDLVYCGSQIPSLKNYLHGVTLVFKSDKFVVKKGFKLTYSMYTCGGSIINATDLSSNVLKKYPNSLNCEWTIEAPKDKIVILKFNYIHLEAGYQCSNDYIAVYEGSEKNYGQRLALMCGYVNSTTVIRSIGNKLLLNFVTDSSITHDGFKANVFFSYSTSVGCGGTINVTSESSTILKSPLIGDKVVYENFLDCFWIIKSPADTQIRIKFTSFHISPCSFAFNQTVIGINKCDCDLVELRDGINPDSISIGSYCGHSPPPSLISSGNILGVRLYTDGELVSSGFAAELIAEPSVCGQSVYSITGKVIRFKSPGYNTGSILKGLNCIYHFVTDSYMYNTYRITIKNLDLQSASVDEQGLKHCDKDSLTITHITSPNVTLGKDFVVNYNSDLMKSYRYFDTPKLATCLQFCGLKETTDYYFTGGITMALKTSSESSTHKGFEIEVVTTGFCGRNYTETYGRILTDYISINENTDCYTLITVPENHTVSLYFNMLSSMWHESSALYIYDGNDTSAPRLKSLRNKEEITNPVFSTGRYVLIQNHDEHGSHYKFDIVYMSSNKGRGCGGTLHSTEGKVTSPLYPYQYRRVSTCEWVLETPVGTRLFLHFSVFNLGSLCDQNYLQLVDSTGNIISTFCSEPPADYTSKDNYVKIVFITNQNNGGTGWEAHFLSAAPGR